MSWNFLHRYGEDIAEKVFAWILYEVEKAGYLEPEVVFIDATHVRANANLKKQVKKAVPQAARTYDEQLRKEINADRQAHGKEPFPPDDPDDEPPMKETVTSETDPDCGLFHKGEHQKCFAYGAHTVCDKNNFILDVEVKAGNIHDSLVFDTVYDRVTARFPEVRIVTADAGYKTPWICKKVLDDGRIPSLPYKRPQTKKGNLPWYDYVYDMPMEEMAKDPEFPKKWMFGMAMMLKKGLHLNQIHNIDRSFNDMMLGLESWIPMYMTGQISPYYLKSVQNNVFMHFLKVSGSAALTGEAISGCNVNGKYYLTKQKDEVSYYKRLANDLLKKAMPLMDIYREDTQNELKAFLLADTKTEGNRRSILSAPPLYTMTEEYLTSFLQARFLSETDKQQIFEYASIQRQYLDTILAHSTVEDELPVLTRQEFSQFPSVLSLSGLFYEKDLAYTYEDYTEHLRQTKEFAESHPNYTVKLTNTNAFRNIQIIIHEGEWVMVSKGKSPAIHFVIRHPKLRNAIENMIVPVTEE